MTETNIHPTAIVDAAAKLGSATDPKPGAKTTPTKLWAAFVLSGRGE